MVNSSSVLLFTPKYSDDLQSFELGQIVVNFARVVPGGMVVFLPSYKTLEKVKKLWEEKGIMGAIRNKKRVRTYHCDLIMSLTSYRCLWSQQPTSTSCCLSMRKKSEVV